METLPPPGRSHLRPLPSNPPQRRSQNRTQFRKPRREILLRRRTLRTNGIVPRTQKHGRPLGEKVRRRPEIGIHPRRRFLLPPTTVHRRPQTIPTRSAHHLPPRRSQPHRRHGPKDVSILRRNSRIVRRSTPRSSLRRIGPRHQRRNRPSPIHARGILPPKQRRFRLPPGGTSTPLPANVQYANRSLWGNHHDLVEFVRGVGGGDG
mmetsp:Transcript_29303/g.60139  ORF Transcript_29303/g.60139 Transcript_29303/m.60139 type:complete len:206 (-) Transcript_29303:521-1138(-)